ncbi:hypothetical protein BURMUCGD1_3692 [Burkholderia multivorans CGD1]|nr:hypothetical protein BURMUCGD1_3692 [Burkholderia multivorans CGD1]
MAVSIPVPGARLMHTPFCRSMSISGRVVRRVIASPQPPSRAAGMRSTFLSKEKRQCASW